MPILKRGILNVQANIRCFGWYLAMLFQNLVILLFLFFHMLLVIQIKGIDGYLFYLFWTYKNMLGISKMQGYEYGIENNNNFGQ